MAIGDEPKPNNQKEAASDMEVVFTLIKHIAEPCKDLEGHDIRDFYIREAKRILPTIKNPFAKDSLENIVKKYENQE